MKVYVDSIVNLICLVSNFIMLRIFLVRDVYWFGGHSGWVTPGLVSIPEVKSSCVFCGTVA